MNYFEIYRYGSIKYEIISIIYIISLVSFIINIIL
uniref:Uncharacterized protein n=1 Tax=Grateloupia filicina TaxID=31455 RepID=A0A2S1FXI0_9FLOR|nr:hypothetical protein Grafi_p104 [Grateloupia filicina]AWD77479.1 hypothetical protein Grafi_p104 [Grateloupia filicina]